MTEPNSADAYIVKRYERLWRRWQPQYEYKGFKGARISQIASDTGGLPALAAEIGVGPGGVAAAVSARGVKIVGIDLSQEALARAREHCRSANVHLMRASGFALPFRNGSLPLVYASQVLHLFDSEGRIALMREVHRVLQPGGRFIFDMKNASSHILRVARYSSKRRKQNFPRKSEVKSLLDQAGFSGVKLMPGVLPLLRWTHVPNIALFRVLSHTTFFVATRAGR